MDLLGMVSFNRMSSMTQRSRQHSLQTHMNVDRLSRYGSDGKGFGQQIAARFISSFASRLFACIPLANARIHTLFAEKDV